MRSIASLVVVVGLSACAPAHLRTVSLGGSRELSELFLGGWDGHKLGVFDDTALEPGVTTHQDALRALRKISSSQYALAYVEKAKLDDAFRKAHAAFCDTDLCLVVFELKQAQPDGFGEAAVVVELKGPGNDPIGNVWLAGRAIRAPGPRRWDLLCRTKADPPRWVHPDGGALYPVRPGLGADGFALFGPTREPAEYRRGFASPSPNTCDEEADRISREEAPERPVIKADPSLLGTDPK